MNFTRVYGVVLRQYYLLRGSLARLVPLFAWAGIDIVLWGFITKYLSGFQTPGFNFVTTLLGAIVLWDLFIRVTHGLGLAFLEDVWSRNFINIFTTPVTTAEYLLGLVITGIATSFLALGGMLVIAVGFFHLPLETYGTSILPCLLIVFMFGIALGIFSIAMVLRLGPASEWFLWPIPAIMSPFVGVFYPMKTLPVWMQYIGEALPPSYVFEGLRAVLAGDAAAPVMMAKGIALAAGYILLAAFVFRATYRRAVRTGLIARYSAESVS